MALEFPRDMTSEACWETADLRLMHRQELARSAGGLTQAKDMGEPLWVATYETWPMRAAAADNLWADFLTLGDALRPFLLVPQRRKMPQALTGNTLSGDITAIRADRTGLRVGGLIATGKVRRGDFISIPHPLGGREFLMAVRDADVTNGVTDMIEVVPPLRPSVAVGQTASFREPKVEMILRPGTLDKARDGFRRWRIRFEAVQVIR